MEYRNWWASVKYSARYGSRKFDEVLVSKIQYEYVSKTSSKTKSFKPQNFTDFEPAQWYVVWSEKDVSDGKEHPFYALIGRLAGM